VTAFWVETCSQTVHEMQSQKAGWQEVSVMKGEEEEEATLME